MMNKYQERIIQIALSKKSKIILPEQHDIRIKKAISKLSSIGIEIINMEDYKKRDGAVYLNNIKKKSFSQNWNDKSIIKFLHNPINFGMNLVDLGEADGLIAGAVTSTSDIIRSAIRIVGIHKSSRWLSSIFFMISSSGNKAYTFSDCGVIPEPDSEQLAVIAKDASDFHSLLTGDKSKVAFLSFSTKGSAKHYRIDKVKKAVEIFGKKYPNILYDGELQVDAAIIPSIAEIKAPKSKLNGGANVLIFPNLDAGNIAYKLTERLANFSAWGPLLQGLNKPIHDLSRGCSIDDIVNVATITAMQKNIYANI